jgi:two-component system response regulator HydG
VHLVADRFVVDDEGHARDLATGERVLVAVSSAGGPGERLRWTARCEWLATTRHPCLAVLLDFGLLGETRRFEAWRAERPWSGSDEEAERALRRVSRFFVACGRTEKALAAADVWLWRGHAVVRPGPDVAHEASAGEGTAASSLDECGIRLLRRREAGAIAEAIVSLDGRGPRALGFWGPEGAGVATAIRELARATRLHGRIPVTAALVEERIARLVRDRSLLVIAGATASRPWLRLLEWTHRSPRAHVLLCTSFDASARLDSAHLAPVPAAALVSSVLPAARTVDVDRAVEQAARQARGLPGRFAQLLWACAPEARANAELAGPSIAAEQPAAYAVRRSSAGAAGAAFRLRSPGETAAVRGRVQAAVAAVERGRRAAGERELRAAAAALGRRHDWLHASRAALALAGSLLGRGRPDAACRAIAIARAYNDRAGDEGAQIDAAILSGVAWCDLGRLEPARALLTTARNAARAGGDEKRLARAALALARCLFWGGQYEEADRCARIGDEGAPAAAAVRASVARARAAVGNRDILAAVEHGTRALEVAERLGDAVLVAQAAAAAAFVHLAVGDGAGVARDLATALRAARAARDPLGALRARLIAAEHERRAGRLSAGRRLVRRLARIVPTLPPILRARCALLEDLLADVEPSSAIAERHASLTGLAALPLFGPPPRESSARGLEAAGVLEILQVCQRASDDRAALRDACAAVRGRLHALSVGIVVTEKGSLTPLAWDGEPPDSDMAARVVDARAAIQPHRWREGVEGGVPVEFGGDTLGAMVGRWTIAPPPEIARATMLMTMAATVAGPLAAAALARRAMPPPDTDDLPGLSASIAEVRQAIERAACAPFPVLIEGESGSGKELVARALHRRGPRRDRPFCTLNCAALPDELVEAELFGHTRGAFTGAAAERIGVFEEAHTGTLFLDEVGELSLRAQAKILRTLQDGEIRRVGENLPRRIDVRVVSATNRDLRREVTAGRFRLDLLYRLDVVRIVVPPLRDRREDVGPLAYRFWQESAAHVGSRATLAAATVAALARHDWPGNVRELQNVIAALAVRGPRRGPVPPEALPQAFHGAGPRETWRLDEARRTFEGQFVRAALVRTGGHRERAAQELGMTRQGLAKLMARLGIRTVDDRRGEADHACAPRSSI